MTISDIRKMAYDVAKKFGLSNPFNKTTQMAGKGFIPLRNGIPSCPSDNRKPLP